MPSDPPRVALLDACVLFRGRLADFLFHLAEAGLFEPAWSAGIEAEWMRGLERRRAIPPEVIRERRALMALAFPDAACVPDPATLAGIEARCVTPAQRKDAHVIAAAMAAGAHCIVTENIADMPNRLLAPCGVQAVRPDAFCAALLAADPGRVLAAIRLHRASLAACAADRDAYLALLAGRAMSLRQTARRLAPYRDRI